METKEAVFYEYNHEYYRRFLQEDDEPIAEDNSSSGYKNVILIKDVPQELIEVRLRELLMEFERKSEEEMASVFFTDDPGKVDHIRNVLITNDNGFRTIEYRKLIERNTIYS
ncbi:MAG TPA: hypothetical protein VD908_13060 [Cytophagales bacterium]|nr:hypothetical protein [Cytophagales bacterium]